MLAKLTSKNQITIPKALLAQVPESTHFEVTVQDGVILLRPVHLSGDNLADVRRKMKALGLNEDAVAEAVQW
ncbi:MAG: AbrB/MazE/SpoVT family DNA-binding domain-containing protein, partial [Desulfohalobiaceae bacterium]|nr:AbrB/MazE/SpoVT family DNA-binding domain-containing protein [Desulfohalobiaceae bacterium]